MIGYPDLYAEEPRSMEIGILTRTGSKCIELDLSSFIKQNREHLTFSNSLQPTELIFYSLATPASL